MLKAWYREHLGVGGGCGVDEQGESNEWVWFHAGGPMVFEPFKADTDYFPADRTAMINLRVRDMDGLLAQLRGAKIDVITKEEWDCDGNRPLRPNPRSRKAIRSSCGNPQLPMIWR